MRAFLGLIAGILAATCAWGQESGPGGTPLIELRATPVEIVDGRLDGLVLHGTVELTSDNSDFGGLSGLLMADGKLIAVSDGGWWFLADVEDRGNGLFPTLSGYAPMTDADGIRLDKGGRDAEGLTVRDGFMAVSFEHDHRISFHLEEGRLDDDVTDARFERFRSNKGLEGLATTPDGWIIAIPEEPAGSEFPVFVLRYSGEFDRAALPVTGRHLVTGADVGPDGRLYVLKRDFSLLLGFSIRVERYDLDSDGFPLPDTLKTLAAWENASGIDNMEGIALWTDSRGDMRLTLISDDNFNALQRTILMDFTVLAED
ncbi:MAG: esterase-like activity of phytase family protein [Pseudomonadota bacterium]